VPSYAQKRPITDEVTVAVLDDRQRPRTRGVYLALR